MYFKHIVLMAAMATSFVSAAPGSPGGMPRMHGGFGEACGAVHEIFDDFAPPELKGWARAECSALIGKTSTATETATETRTISDILYTIEHTSTSTATDFITVTSLVTEITTTQDVIACVHDMKYFTTLTYPFFQMERRAAPTPASGPRPDPLGMFGSKLKRFACSCLLGDDGIVPYYVATTTVTPFTVKKTMKVTDIGSMSTIYSGYATDKTVTITTATITATAEPEDLAIVTVTRTKTITEGTLDVTQVVPVPAPTVCAKVGAIMWPTKGAMGVANWYSRNRCRDFCAENSRYCRCFVWNKGTCRYFNHYCPEIYKADAMSSWEFYDQNCPIESLGKVGGD